MNKNGPIIRTNRTTELRFRRSPSTGRKLDGFANVPKDNTGSQTSMVSSGGGGGSSVTIGCAAAPRARLLRSRASTPLTPLSAPDSPARRRAVLANAVGGATTGYDSDGGGDSLRLDRAAHAAVKQDILGVKAMLVKLKRVLNESETHNPLDSQTILTNGIFSSPYPSTASNCDGLQESEDSATKAKFELAELRKQVLFLQGQIEDRETTIQSLQEQMVKLANENYHANSAPASVTADCQMCNAATQTERIRPISAGPSLLNGSPVDGSAASLVSFRIGKVVLADVLFGVIILCAINLICFLNIIYTCSSCCLNA
nr:unnamed protein product [Callosobruchus chinensis]